MRNELEQILIEKFPLYYRPNPYGCNQERFCFETEDSWFDLLLELSEKIELMFKQYPLIYGESFTVFQVKEKFGELRFYYNINSEGLDYAVLSVIQLSLSKCISEAERKAKDITKGNNEK